tara:strand:+ start:3479 stop:4546 length:1068 start_codon:yes stop_codon:yes gene_type:complete
MTHFYNCILNVYFFLLKNDLIGSPSVLYTMNQKSKQETFINKYKPYFLKDFYFSNELHELISDFLELDRLSVLFIGNTSSGKTTLLNTIIREYYELGKDSSFPENNILYINNLKDQGIQFFRNEMKTFCQSHSSIYGKKKMVIIDDLDNINEQSQQVFRNYIDKYKQNVHFVTVCTNLQKVIESLQSRLHMIKIEVPSKTQMQSIMETIIDNEGINIDSTSKEYVLQLSGTSIRMLINYLEKMFVYNNPITMENCDKICCTMPSHYFEDYIQFLKGNEIKNACDVFFLLHDQGYSVIDILDAFFVFVKITPILTEKMKYKLIPQLCKYITVFHNIHEHPIEIALFTKNIQSIIIN